MPELLVVTPPGPDADALCASLKDRGFEVHLAGSGAAAVDVAFRKKPDLILMDPALSAMDRWHAVKQLNADANTSRIPVLTLAADAASPDGFERALAKIERTLGHLPGAQGAPHPDGATPPRGLEPRPSGLAPRPDTPKRPEGRLRPGALGSRPTGLSGRPGGLGGGPGGYGPGGFGGGPGGFGPGSFGPGGLTGRPGGLAGRPGRRSGRAGGLGARPGALEGRSGLLGERPGRRTAVPKQGFREAEASDEGATEARPGRGAARQAEAPATDNQGRVLVVDDNALNRDMLARRLSRRGYKVEVAEDGQQALDTLEDQSFDLVLLDWMMPGLSGIDVLKRLRETYTRIQLPVIMATAKTEADDIVEALRAEANDYVTKPLNFDIVNARIRTQLGLVQAHQDLADSERRYRALLENTGDMIVQYRKDGAVLYVSPACRTLLGYEADVLEQRNFYDWIHAADRKALQDQRDQDKLPSAFTFIARMLRQDQSYIWVETSCRVVEDASGGAHVQAAVRDVSERMDRSKEDDRPLGGDIMAHPGREDVPAADRPPADATGRSSVEVTASPALSAEQAPRSPADPSADSPPNPLQAPPKTAVVLLTLLDGLELAKVGDDEAARTRVTQLLGDKLLAALEKQNG